MQRVRFDADWLALREPADAAARAPELVAPFAAALTAATPKSPRRLVDLGAGAGSNLRYLAPRLGIDGQHWRLIDHDENLLRRVVEPADVTVEPCRLDLAHDLAALSLAPGEVVTAAALLDLVSADWLDCFVRWLAGAPLLAVLTYDGRLSWTPADPDDAMVTTLFNRHQRRDKGFGPALGATAADRLAAQLAQAGYRVRRASSPWRLGSGDAELQRRLLAGIAGAAIEEDGSSKRVVKDWLARRLAAIAAGALACTVGHADLVATL